MNTLNPTSYNPLDSDNLQTKVIEIRGKIFSIEAENIKEKVDGQTTINTNYKKESIGSQLRESYEGPYTVNRQNINTKVQYTDTCVIQANSRIVRYGNRVRFSSVSDLQLCLGINEARKIGILGILAPLKVGLVIGVAAKISLTSILAYNVNTFKKKSWTKMAGIQLERWKVEKVIVKAASVETLCVSKKEWKIRKRFIQTSNGPKQHLYT